MRKCTAKPNYKHCTIFDENLVAVHIKKNKLVFDKPAYLGTCILDLSKTLMYDFHYNYRKKKYRAPGGREERAKLIFPDTDSFAYEIETLDFFTKTYVRMYRKNLIQATTQWIIYQE